MLDPRIYRTGFVAVALAVFVFAFSLQDQPGALQTTLAPQAFNGAAAFNTMTKLAQDYPSRSPGSAGDQHLADYVYSSLEGLKKNFTISTHSFTASTQAGTRTLETVSALNPGLSGGAIVIVSSRDAAASSASASLSGTAVMLQLAQALQAQSNNHSIMLVSTSGSVGAAGTTELAQQLAGQPVDAVIVLGDLASLNVSQPVVVPWSDGRTLAPPLLRNTLAAALGAEANLGGGSAGLPAQLARLAFPLTITPQGPFASHGIPAVTVSLSGERGVKANETASAPIVEARISGMGQAMLQTIDALDGGQDVPVPASYLLLNGKVVPFWSIRLLVLALMFPVIGVMVDGLARARRRGHTMIRWTGWVLAGALPFWLGGLVVRAGKLISLLPAAPPGPVGARGVPLQSSGIVLLSLVAVVVLVSFALLRPLCIRLAARFAGQRSARREADGEASEGAGPALLLVACVAAVAVWWTNPFAALLLVPALHLWVWVVDSDIRMPRPVAFALLLIGLIPPGLVIAYYVHAFGLSAIGAIWNGALLIAGGQLGLGAVLEWSLVLGCLVSAIVIAVRRRSPRGQGAEAVTVRGPVTYAGPGSLGGTESALRR